jgi:hypothetical protein
MSLSEEKRVLLSQLVDGELPVDEANQLLGGVFRELSDVLCNSEAGMELNAMLQLRQAIDPWRRQGPPKAVVSLPPVHPTARGSRLRWPTVGYAAAAALLGGVLVAGGFLLGGRRTVEQADTFAAKKPVVVVSPEQRQDIAQAFALHESVAGPLSWYAADDSTIQVAPAGKAESLRQPIAVILRLTRELSGQSDEAERPITYVIVCRDHDPATIELPRSAVAKAVRLRLFPRVSKGEVSLQYAIAADAPGRGANEAAMAGRRDLNLSQSSLGQLALNDRLVNVDASAWVIDQGKP